MGTLFEFVHFINTDEKCYKAVLMSNLFIDNENDKCYMYFRFKRFWNYNFHCELLMCILILPGDSG